MKAYAQLALLAFGILLSPSVYAAGGQLTIKGSDTMVHLVSSWAEDFMTKYEGSEVSVTGGGSGTGIAALINGTTDLCASSRDLKEEERGQAAGKGRVLVEHKVAIDGLAIVVHPSNPVGALTIEQLGKMYTGELTNWNQVGGQDSRITLLSRESSSGTYVFFQEHVLNKKDYAANTRLMPATAALVQAVSTDKSAVAYIGLGYAHEAGKSVKVVLIKKNASLPAVLPSEDYGARWNLSYLTTALSFQRRRGKGSG